MSVNAVSWAIDRAPVPGNRCVARMILVHLADKADADGRDTWKYVSAIADAIGVDDSTVHRNLAWLEEHGLIERGDQRLVDDYPEYARPVVWNLRLDKVREPSDRETKKRRAGRPRKHTGKPTRDLQPGIPVSPAQSEKPGGDSRPGIPETENPVAPVQPGWSRPCDRGGCTGAIQNTHKHPETYNPSAPTGHLPAAGGATPGNGTDDGTTDGAGRVLDELARLRRDLGLSVREPSKTDRRAVTRLLKRLRDQGSPDPSQAVLMVLDSAFEGSWWPRLIRDGRCLESNWDKLADDAVLSARGDAGNEPVRPAAGRQIEAHAHSASCGHVAAIVDSSDAVAVEPDGVYRHGAGDMVAGWLNDGMNEGEALKRLCSILKDAAEDRRRDRERLERIRAARGGRMFAGAMKPGIEVTR